MAVNSFHFQREKFNRLFPFFILLDKNLRVLDYGESLKKVARRMEGEHASKLFAMVRPGDISLDFDSLRKALDVLTVIQLVNDKRISLRGQFEYLSDDQVLFVGSPWFNSIEEMMASDLSLDDFAYHDQLIDLLHLVKSQEITTDDLKSLVKKINEQKNHLINNERTLKLLSQIAEDNVNAVIICDLSGKIMWANHSFTKMTGYSANEYIGMRPGKLLQGANSDPETVAYLSFQVQNRQPFNAEIINYTKEGKEYWVRIQGQPFYDEKDEFGGFFAIEENITRERQIQEQLLEAERRLRLALEKIGDNVWEHNFITNTTEFSRHNNEFIGSTMSSEISNAQQWWSHVHQDDLVLLEENDRKIRSGEIDSHSLRYRMMREDGTIRWVLDRGMVIEKNAAGLPLKIIGTHTDITKIKETEAELAARVSQFKSLSENIPAVIYEYVFKKDGTEYMKYVSPSMETVLGIPAKEFQKNPLRFLHPDDVDKVRTGNERSRRTLESFSVEARLLLPDNSIAWHHVSSSFAHQTEEGDLVFTGIMLNTTDRKKAEDALRINEEKYRNIISNMNLGLLEVTIDDTITFANESFAKLTGYEVDEMLGKKAHELFLTNGEEHKVLEKTERRGQGFSDAYEIQLYDRNNVPHWVMISGAPRYNDKGEFIGSIGIHVDITEQKKLQELLITAKEEAVHLAKAKELFLANMSHEIRTPLNAVIGMIREMKYTTLDSQQAQHIRNAEASSNHLLSLVNNILDLSKISSGNFELDHTPFRCSNLCDEVNAITKKLADDKKIDLIFENKLSANKSYIGDAGRIRQVMINVIGNAIKFTEKGSVTISCENGQSDEVRDELIISVVDTGIGMDEKFIHSIFDKFSQENNSIQRKYGGTGLGMSITKQLVELMNGTIAVKSKRDEGTTFTIRLWLEKSDEVVESNSSSELESVSLVGKKILVVEDNEMNRLVAGSLLMRNKMQVTFAENGQIGIEKVSANHFDLILMDMQMPVVDGLEATHAIRKAGIKTPIIALTANAFKAEIDRAIQAGMNDFVSKPFDESVLLQKMKAALSKLTLKETELTASLPENKFTLAGPLIDESYLNSIAGDNAEFKQQIFEIFKKQSSDFLIKADGFFQAEDWPALTSLAHQFKPQGTYLGASGLSKLIATIETESRTTKNKAAISQSFLHAQEWIVKINAEIDLRMDNASPSETSTNF